jgi:hypothetical protein
VGADQEPATLAVDADEVANEEVAEAVVLLQLVDDDTEEERLLEEIEEISAYSNLEIHLRFSVGQVGLRLWPWAFHFLRYHKKSRGRNFRRKQSWPRH